MGTSSILGAHSAPRQARGRDTDALGPSDSSDSGSDIQAEPSLETQSDRSEILSAPRDDYAGETDASGTGERSSALPDEKVRDGADIGPDRIEHPGDADLSDSDELDDAMQLAVDEDDSAADEFDEEDEAEAS